MRVLHLIDGTGGPGVDLDLAAEGCRLAVGLGAGGGGGREEAEGAEDTHEVWLVGAAASLRRVRSAGVRVARVLSPPLGEPALAWRALRRAAGAIHSGVLVCWGAGMLDLSRLAFPAALARVVVTERGPGPGLLRTAAAWMGEPVRCAIAVCPEGPAEERVRAAFPGLEVMAAPPPCVLKGAGGAGAAGAAADREAARRELGLGPADLALLLAGREASAMRFTFLQGLLACAGRRVVGVMPAWAGELARGRRMRARAGRDVRMIVSPLPLARLAAACDAGVWDPGGPGPTAHRSPLPGEGAWQLAPLVAAGLPTVAPEAAWGHGLLPREAAGACVAHNGTLPELSRVLCPLLDDAALRRRTGEALRAHAAAADCGGRFAAVLGAAWKEARRTGKISTPLPKAMFTAMGVPP